MEQILGSWKEIAGYLGKSTRTVQRWELELGLPVHRPVLSSHHIVMARKSELDSWMDQSVLLKNPMAADASRPMPTILLSEKQERTRSLLGSLLELFGYTVVYSDDSEAGIQTAMANQLIDLVVLDTHDSAESVSKLTTSLAEMQPQLKVLVLLDDDWMQDSDQSTSPAMHRESREALTVQEYGGWPVLSAPLRSDHFLYAVRTLLDAPASALPLRHAIPFDSSSRLVAAAATQNEVVESAATMANAGEDVEEAA